MTILAPPAPSARSSCRDDFTLQAALKAAVAIVGQQEPKDAPSYATAAYQGFTAWLIRQAGRRDPVGHLAYEVIRDSTWPGDVSVWSMSDYLEASGAIPAALAALQSAWAEWTTPNEMRNCA